MTLIYDSPELLKEMTHERVPGRVAELVRQGHRNDIIFSWSRWMRFPSEKQIFEMTLEALEAGYEVDARDRAACKRLDNLRFAQTRSEKAKVIRLIRRLSWQGTLMPFGRSIHSIEKEKAHFLWVILSVASCFGSLPFIKWLWGKVDPDLLRLFNDHMGLECKILNSAAEYDVEVFKFLYEKGKKHHIRWPHEEDNSLHDLFVSALSYANVPLVRFFYEQGDLFSSKTWEASLWLFMDENEAYNFADGDLLWEKRKAMIDLLLSYGADIHYQAENGITPLMEASYYEGNTEVQRKTMAYLLERGAKVDVVSASHNTALCIALRAADLEVVELLLSWGADIHQKCGPDHAPVIVEIAALGFVDKFEFLLAHGADLDDIQTMVLLKTESDPKIKPLIAKWEQEKLDSVTCMVSSSGDGQAIYRL